jgi:hypothetical protein
LVLVGGAYAGWLAWLVDRRRRSYADLATTPAAAVFAGRNEVKGRAWAAEPLVSHRSRTPSVWWEYLLYEERQHTRTVTSRDAQGNTSTRVETYNQWHQIDRKHARLPWCEVVDDSGSVRVRLDGAQIETRSVFSDTFRDDGGRGLIESLFSNRTGRYRESENAIAIGDQLFVVGQAELDEVTCAPVIAGDPLVTTRTEESRMYWLGAGVVLLVLLAVVGVIVGGALALDPDQPERPFAWLPGLAASVILLTIAWSVTLYNRLRLLAESAERAWTLVDVQLQRRHDLIPALAKAVAAHTTHEATVLEQLARSRSGGAGSGTDGAPTDGAPTDGAAADGEAVGAGLAREAAEQTGRLRQILGVAEAHPDLTADASFLELQRTLADTESRIAGSRTFYNDTLLLLRNQMTRFPGVLVANRLRLAHGEAIGAEGFERTVPAVERTFA